MSRIQSDLNTDLPRAIGSAWKVLIGRIAYFFRLSKNGVRKRSATPSSTREVQLQQLLDRVEHAADAGGARVAGDAFDAAVGEQVDVEVGAEPLQAGGERQRHVVAVDMVGVEAGGGQHGAERGRIVARGVGEALVDGDGGDHRVEQDGADRVLEAADRHGLVDEGVLGPAQAAELGRLLRAAVGGAGRDDEHLEIGPVARRVAHRRGIELGRGVGELLGGLPGAGVMLVGAGQDRLGDPPGKARGALGVTGGDALAQRREQARAGIGEELLVGAELVERGGRCLAVRTAGRPGAGRGVQLAPPVGAGAGQREEVVDPVPVVGPRRRATLAHRCFLCCVSGHR